jgi:serine/threonine protein phosphatase PrpC
VENRSCPSCGAINRGRARYCYQCAALLPRPSVEDHDWLSATLAGDSASVPAAPADPAPLAAGRRAEASEEKGATMEQPQQADADQTALVFAGRYEIATQRGDDVTAIDRQPWKRCWACGATSNEAGELFCTECGAALDGRHYRGQLTSGEPAGLALVPAVADAAARELLPPIWDQVQDDGRTLTLVADSGRAALAPPLEEQDALLVGRGLARLLQKLHAEGLALGALQPADLELGADGLPRLRDAPGLRRIVAGDDNNDDLRALATLLEALTGTERTTKRLDEDQATQLIAEPGLPDILRELRTGAVTDAAALAERLDSLIAERTQPAPLWVRIGAASHAGMVRDVDEDSLLALDLRMVQNSRGRSWGLFIVADGMGGHDAGEVASGLAIRGAAEVILSAYLAPTIESDAQYEEARLKEIVRKAILQANEYVIREAQARSNDMGTTITMALVVGDRAVIGNIGDSRTYIYREGALRRITNDHSLVMRLVDIGQITEDEIYTHPQRNAVLRSLGDKPELEVDLFSERLRSGDALLLCCDGQWEMTRNPQMAELIARHDDPQAACDALIAAANAAGGEDNITSVLVRFEKYGE